MPAPSEGDRVAVLHARVDQLDARSDATERMLIVVAFCVAITAIGSMLRKAKP